MATRVMPPSVRRVTHRVKAGHATRPAPTWRDVDDETTERIQKYEAHAVRLRSELDDLGRHRSRIGAIPLALVLAPLGLFASLSVALAIAGAVLLLTAVASYLNASRTWYTKKELADVARELDVLRHGDPTRDTARDLRWWTTSRAMLEARARRA